MIVYEVNLRVAADSAEAFRAWLDEHVRAMLGLPGFLGAEIFGVEPPDIDIGGPEPSGRHWTVHYRMQDRAALDAYFARDAARMRAEGVARFGGRFSAERRILQVESQQQIPP